MTEDDIGTLPSPKSRQPTIGVFSRKDGIVLREAPNGGWIAYAYKDPIISGSVIGAYSCASEMLDALADALGG